LPRITCFDRMVQLFQRVTRRSFLPDLPVSANGQLIGGRLVTRKWYLVLALLMVARRDLHWAHGLTTPYRLQSARKQRFVFVSPARQFPASHGIGVIQRPSAKPPQLSCFVRLSVWVLGMSSTSRPHRSLHGSPAGRSLSGRVPARKTARSRCHRRGSEQRLR